MIVFKLTILGIVLALVGAVLLEIYLLRGKSRPLANHRAARRRKPQLGMEATDLASVAHILQRNDALAHATGAGGQSASWLATGAIASAPYQDDASYAAEFGLTQDERGQARSKKALN